MRKEEVANQASRQILTELYTKIETPKKVESQPKPAVKPEVEEEVVDKTAEGNKEFSRQLTMMAVKHDDVDVSDSELSVDLSSQDADKEVQPIYMTVWLGEEHGC